MSFALIKLRCAEFRTVVHNSYIDAAPPLKLKTQDYIVCIAKHGRDPNFVAVYCDSFNPNLLEATYKCTVLFCGEKDECLNQLENGRNSSVPERFLVILYKKCCKFQIINYLTYF